MAEMTSGSQEEATVAKMEQVPATRPIRTPAALFRRRVGQHLRWQWLVWRTVIDWTVWVYVFIPAALYGGSIYRHWWKAPPEWMVNLRLGTFAAIFAVILFSMGRLRTFIEEPDAIMLLQRPKWLSGLRLRGALYSMFWRLLFAAAPIAVTLVWSVQVKGLSAGQISLWYVLTAAIAIVAISLRSIIEANLQGLRRTILLWTLASLLTVGYTWLIPGLLGGGVNEPASRHTQVQAAGLTGLAVAAGIALAAAAVGFLLRLRFHGTLQADIESERASRLTLSSLVLRQIAPVKRPRPMRTRPVLFSRSGRLIRGNGQQAIIADSFMKSLLRKIEYVRLLLLFYVISTVALLIAPGWIAAIGALVLPLIGTVWARDRFEGWMEEPFIKGFAWDAGSVKEGMEKSLIYLLVPLAALLGGLAGWKATGIIGAVFGIGIGYLWLAIILLPLLLFASEIRRQKKQRAD
ncbi:ABC transporter permease [Paenibacillus sp. MMS18-CY102]|uniref:ABC transporter permease n=1 Tax=Paenibacillus sp. MMS18-CY102 TaxID=2682849 RepID=UPI00136658E9|nr:ABC transporter permease [Paenibacillus sp. MMS18-CY102]MWC30309.1 hypothetical protein [Paenibacillus sp. MMS18-CY102]